MTAVEKLDDILLRKYDIRGVWDAPLTPQTAYSLGRRFGYFVGKNQGKSVVVGYDGRTTSPMLNNALIQGLRDQGIDTLSIGLCPTPMLSFAHFYLNTDAAVMVTGSHNPKDYNGFKLTFRTAPFYDENLKALNNLDPQAQAQKGSLAHMNLLPAYVERLVQDASNLKPLKVVWDAGHGAAGVVLPELIKRLPGSHTLLYGEVDGSFPAHHPDPTVEENLMDLREKVLETGADVGMAFDGDGDRLGVVDNKGTVIWADTYLLLLAQQVLGAAPKAKIIADVKASQRLFKQINHLGGEAIMAPTGHSLIKKALKDTGALLAGEMSGHIFFADKYYGYDDALYAGVRLLQAISQLPGPLHDWLTSLPPSYATPEIRLPFCGDRQAILATIKKKIEGAPGLYIDLLDGLRVTYPDGSWWLLRQSNTQDIFVVRCEAPAQTRLKDIKDELRSLLHPHGLNF